MGRQSNTPSQEDGISVNNNIPTTEYEEVDISTPRSGSKSSGKQDLTQFEEELVSSARIDTKSKTTASNMMPSYKSENFNPRKLSGSQALPLRRESEKRRNSSVKQTVNFDIKDDIFTKTPKEMTETFGYSDAKPIRKVHNGQWAGLMNFSVNDVKANLTDTQKENFNLRLYIHHLEEELGKNGHPNYKDDMNAYIEAVEKKMKLMKRDINEKNFLNKKANDELTRIRAENDRLLKEFENCCKKGGCDTCKGSVCSGSVCTGSMCIGCPFGAQCENCPKCSKCRQCPSCSHSREHHQHHHHHHSHHHHSHHSHHSHCHATHHHMSRCSPCSRCSIGTHVSRCTPSPHFRPCTHCPHSATCTPCSPARSTQCPTCHSHAHSSVCENCGKTTPSVCSPCAPCSPCCTPFAFCKPCTPCSPCGPCPPCGPCKLPCTPCPCKQPNTPCSSGKQASTPCSSCKQPCTPCTPCPCNQNLECICEPPKSVTPSAAGPGDETPKSCTLSKGTEKMTPAQTEYEFEEEVESETEVGPASLKEKSCSLTNSKDKTCSFSNVKEKSSTLTNSQDKTCSLADIKEKTCTLTNSQDKICSLGDTKEKSCSLDSLDKKCSLTNEQPCTVTSSPEQECSLAKLEEVNTTLTNSRDQTCSLNNSKDTTHSSSADGLSKAETGDDSSTEDSLGGKRKRKRNITLRQNIIFDRQ